ncbi:hypothetical protein ACXWRW_11260, partial [Streptococcus pyogenes]
IKASMAPVVRSSPSPFSFSPLFPLLLSFPSLPSLPFPFLSFSSLPSLPSPLPFLSSSLLPLSLLPLSPSFPSFFFLSPLL